MRTRRAARAANMRGGRVVAVLVTAVFAHGLASGTASAQGFGASSHEFPADDLDSRYAQRGFSVVEPPHGLPETKRAGSDDGSGRWFFESLGSAFSPADQSEALYKDAMTALEDGRADDAQRLFERLVAEAPGSRFAGSARQHLGSLYRSVDALPAPEAKKSPRQAGLPAAAIETGVIGTAAGVSVAPVLPRAVIENGRVSVALDQQFLSSAGDRVFFSQGSASLGGRALAVLRAQARFLMQHPDLKAAIEGHADDGQISSDDTLTLSERRAAAVRNLLVAEGVEAERVTAYGRGRDDRVSDCLAPECLAQNRRVITVLLKGDVTFAAPQPRRSAGTVADPVGPSPTQ